MIDKAYNRLLVLRVAKDQKGLAPNKPLLLLAILDLVEVGLVGADGIIHKDAVEDAACQAVILPTTK